MTPLEGFGIYMAVGMVILGVVAYGDDKVKDELVDIQNVAGPIGIAGFLVIWAFLWLPSMIMGAIGKDEE